ncbi:protein kinase domain-containing protein [Streptomyces sp. NPDC002643]
MERLAVVDPSVIGGYRLAGRLGAGGMGVVYLARSPHGAWCAVKVIRAEHAGDPGFRARFRREAELAARIGGRWTVPVVGADAEARSPWLATAYVPGPSLAEAVASHGPWPEGRLRGLGTALAEALEEVHAAGLVHRDVKPANVLLAVDGPRLIDFGIARAVGATALTTDGTIVGSPGYLSPEQARGRTVGPPSDVFSLGCVLAHTATGRPPFGYGGAAAVLYRTVHDEPDLDGVPDGLDETVRRCLAKEAERRPSARELREVLGEFVAEGWLPEGLPALVAARAARVLNLPVPDPTVVGGAPPVGSGAAPVDSGAAPVDSGAAPVGDGAALLGTGAAPGGGGARPGGADASPVPVGTARVAAGASSTADEASRSAAGRPPSPAGPSSMAAGVPPDAAEPSSRPADPAPRPGGASPRSAGASRLGTGRSPSAQGASPTADRVPPTADGVSPGAATPTSPAAPTPVDPPTSPTRRRLLVAGAVAGVTAAGGAGAWWRWGRGKATASAGGVRRARYVVALLGSPGGPFFADHERGARLAVEEHGGDDRRTVDLVLRTVDDGGTEAGSAKAAARLAADPDVSVVIATGANAPVLAALPPCTEARLTVLVTRADAEEFNNVNTTSALVLRSTRTLGPPAVLRHLNRVVKPARTVVVHDLADEAEGLPTVRIATLYDELDSETAVEEVAADEDFTGVARRIAARPRDAVLFAGVTPERAAACARALLDAGHEGARVGGEHILGTPFLSVGEGWRIGTGYTDGDADPRTKEFAAAFRTRHRRAPGPWAAEAYDAVRFAAEGLASVGDTGRSALRSELLRRPWQGITRRMAFDAASQFFRSQEDGGGFLFRVADGAARFVARTDDIGEES